jgi:hypothetical protein
VYIVFLHGTPDYIAAVGCHRTRSQENSSPGSTNVVSRFLCVRSRCRSPAPGSPVFLMRKLSRGLRGLCCFRLCASCFESRYNSSLPMWLSDISQPYDYYHEMCLDHIISGWQHARRVGDTFCDAHCTHTKRTIFTRRSGHGR